ncbi:MAG: hypothetical protein E6J34_07445 [Chloroflexi bacterium]|nr:MAG: hypothetical protein E6J34_07445 [Chloroflexota bacterium]
MDQISSRPVRLSAMARRAILPVPGVASPGGCSLQGSPQRLWKGVWERARVSLGVNGYSRAGKASEGGYRLIYEHGGKAGWCHDGGHGCVGSRGRAFGG